VRIAQTARKHGITDDDMLHAGELLEVGVLGIDTDDPVIVHAMRARPQYLPHR